MKEKHQGKASEFPWLGARLLLCKIARKIAPGLILVICILLSVLVFVSIVQSLAWAVAAVFGVQVGHRFDPDKWEHWLVLIVAGISAAAFIYSISVEFVKKARLMEEKHRR